MDLRCFFMFSLRMPDTHLQTSLSWKEAGGSSSVLVAVSHTRVEGPVLPFQCFHAITGCV